MILGNNEELDAIQVILETCPRAINLAGRTTIFDIPALGRAAWASAGNDTGPMHIVALTGCPTAAIFSTLSFPDTAAPRGDKVRVLVCEELSDLPVERVAKALIEARSPK